MKCLCYSLAQIEGGGATARARVLLLGILRGWLGLLLGLSWAWVGLVGIDLFPAGLLLCLTVLACCCYCIGLVIIVLAWLMAVACWLSC